MIIFLHYYRYFLNGLSSHAHSREIFLDEGLSYMSTIVPSTTTVQNYEMFSKRPTLITLFSSLRNRFRSACRLFRHLKTQGRLDPIVGAREDTHDKKGDWSDTVRKNGSWKGKLKTRANVSSWNLPPQPYAR